MPFYDVEDLRKGAFIHSRGYHQSKARGPCSRRLRDAAPVEHIGVVHAETTVSIESGKYDILSDVKESIAVVNRLLG